jgi:hypothetical protein
MNKALWEILVPTEMDRGTGIVPIKKRFHRIWDEKVRSIAGGMTILTPAKGQWISPKGELFAERMIPVRVMCSAVDIVEIAKMTMDYYNQEAVMYYRVSDDVTIMYKEK